MTNWKLDGEAAALGDSAPDWLPVSVPEDGSKTVGCDGETLAHASGTLRPVV